MLPEAKELTDKAVTLETQTTVEIDGKPVPYRSTQSIVMNEDDRARRSRILELSEKAQAKIKELSGGMKRRLVIARALLKE